MWSISLIILFRDRLISNGACELGSHKKKPSEEFFNACIIFASPSLETTVSFHFGLVNLPRPEFSLFFGGLR